MNKQEFVEIKSPIVGTFTRTGIWPCASSEKPLVRVGDHVEPDTIVCGVTAMMVQNQKNAAVSGTIMKISVEHGDAVGYKQVLFEVSEVKPDPYP